MITFSELISEVKKWNPAAVAPVEQVASLLDKGEAQFHFFPSVRDVLYAVMDGTRGVAYIDAVPQAKFTEFSKEMRGLQTSVVREYPDICLIINLERITPKISDLFGFDLIKLALLSHRIKQYYIIGSHQEFTKLVTAAMNIHDRMVDKEKFHHYETLDSLPVIIKRIEQER